MAGLKSHLCAVHETVAYYVRLSLTLVLRHIGAQKCLNCIYHQINIEEEVTFKSNLTV